ncbi:response regulator [Limnobacter humi]|uniref:Response regulator n=1 Tax=Limnobacter humi TaxID=1778671 RepID=A0ABT1WD15_9BURK|nr:response regulator [Limnobacter humi]MCQ8895413.1 response regulator [Limnobacter humi]
MSANSPMVDRALPRILVVDDSVVERSLFVHMVSKWGYGVEVASSGQEALSRIQHDKFQLVLADWQMPGMQGTELCQQLRDMALEQYTYVILMSAQSDEEFLIKALDAGADDVLSKPIDGNELEARLQSAVRRIELQAQLKHQTDALAQAHKAIADDLKTVSVLQRSYLPPAVSPFPQLHYQWLSAPSMYVSGDHLHVFQLEPDVYGFYLLDVSGHGVPAAVKSMQLVQMFADQSASSLLYDQGGGHATARTVAQPSRVVARLNRLFQQTDTDLSYFTMIYGLMDSRTRKVSLCQAGHPSPLLIKSDGRVRTLGGGGYPVGLFDTDDFEDIDLTLEQGDVLLLYSDGLTEVMSPQDEGFGEDRLLRSIEAQVLAQGGLPGRLPHLIEETILDWGGKAVQQHGFQDDVSILMLSADPFLSVDANPGGRKNSGETVFRHQEILPAHELDIHHELAPKSIVIVDDSKSFLRIFEAMLNSWGYEVHAAKNGHEAVTLIDSVKPDFVLTDWDMPGMSGIELCEHVRAHQDSYIYIIMITGYATRDDLLNSLRVGADDFLTKPVNPSELKVRLKTAERIADLHTSLEARHSELAALYDALQRDMREVSRIQRALLPKTRTEPWPFALQMLYQPQAYVCGQQMGLLETQPNEYGFFMISMPGDDTSTALQAMALSRWFSLDRATQVLFPKDPSSSKLRRHLASPALVQAELMEISPSLGAKRRPFDLLYGLLNLDQGSLLLAGLGHWSVLIAQPGETPLFQAVNAPQGQVIFQDLIKPGSRLFIYPSVCAEGLGLTDPAVWTQSVLLPDDARWQGHCRLEDEFARLLSLNPVLEYNLQDFMLSGIQWREQFDVQPWDFAPNQMDYWKQRLLGLALQTRDRLDATCEPLTLGELRDSMAYRLVCDTTSIGAVSQAVRAFSERLGYDDQVAYNADLAVSEALTNVMVHGFRAERPKPAVIAVLAFEHALGIVLNDQGKPIPVAVLDAIAQRCTINEETELNRLPEGGMGLKFIHLVSSRFDYESTTEGNTLWLVLNEHGRQQPPTTVN